MAGKYRLVKFELCRNGKIEGLICENGTCIVTYVDRNCSMEPVIELQYLVEIKKETTCKSGRNFGKPIYFVNIICPSEEISISQLLNMPVKFEVFNDSDLIFDFAGHEDSYQKLYFRICEHKFEVKKLLPEIYQRFVAYEEVMARQYKTWKNFNCPSQVLAFPVSSKYFKECTTVFTSTIELDPNKLYLANTPNSIDDVTPALYEANLPILRDCYVDNEVALRIRAAILGSYREYECIAELHLITKQGNTISSSNIAYSFNICGEWKGICVNREIVARRNSAGNEFIDCQNNSLLVYKPEPGGNEDEEEEEEDFSFEDHPKSDTVFARIYTTSELLPIFNNTKETKQFIEKLTQDDSYTI
jgi:hypothetical protein